MEIKHSIRTFIKGYKVKENNSITAKVVVRVVWSAGEIMLYSGYYAESHKWDAAQQRCMRNTSHTYKGKTETAHTINTKIAEIEKAVEDAFIVLGISGLRAEDIAPQALKGEIYKRIGLTQREIVARKRVAHERVELIPAENKTLFDYIEDFINEGTVGGWRLETKRKFITLRNKLIEFDCRLSFASLSEEKMQDFVVFLVEQHSYHNNTTQLFLRMLRWFLRWCEKKDLFSDRKVIDFRSKLKDVEDKTIVYLTWEEFQKLYSYQVPESRKDLQEVKDVFIFQSTTGLRYSDLANLRRSNVDLEGNSFTIVTSKTSHKIPIYFNSYSRGIYEKYLSQTYNEDRALPVPYKKKYNEALKELCHLAGITSKITIAYKSGSKVVANDVEKWTKISSHCGRRTFVSVGLSLGATPEEIARVTGHHSLQIMQHYIGVDDNQRKHATSVWDAKTEMDDFSERLNSMQIEEVRRMFALYDAAGTENM